MRELDLSHVYDTYAATTVANLNVFSGDNGQGKTNLLAMPSTGRRRARMPRHRR